MINLMRAHALAAVRTAVYKIALVIASILLAAAPSIAMPTKAKWQETIPYDRWLPILMGAGQTVPGGGTLVGIPPGRLHALTVSVSTPAGVDHYCALNVLFQFQDLDGNVTGKHILSLPRVRDGDISVTTLNLDAPIEFDFDPTMTELQMRVVLNGNVTGSSPLCYYGVNGVYETFDSPAKFLPSLFDPGD